MTPNAYARPGNGSRTRIPQGPSLSQPRIRAKSSVRREHHDGCAQTFVLAGRHRMPAGRRQGAGADLRIARHRASRHGRDHWLRLGACRRAELCRLADRNHQCRRSSCPALAPPRPLLGYRGGSRLRQDGEQLRAPRHRSGCGTTRSAIGSCGERDHNRLLRSCIGGNPADRVCHHYRPDADRQPADQRPQLHQLRADQLTSGARHRSQYRRCSHLRPQHRRPARPQQPDQHRWHQRRGQLHQRHRSTVSQDAVQEFQILTNGYAAEYGQAAGGVINIISKSGSNEFHGSAFGYLRTRYIQATNPFSNVNQPDFTRAQYGIAMGGPIKKDKTYWFFSYEGTDRHETGFSTIGSPNGTFGLDTPADITRFVSAAIQQPLPPGTVVVPVTAQQAAFLNAVPVTPATVNYALLVGTSGPVAIAGVNPLTKVLGLGSGYFANTGAGFIPLPASYVAMQSLEGNFPVHELGNIYSLRLDHKLTNNQQLMLRGSVSPDIVDGIEVAAQGPQTFGQNSQSRTSMNNFHDWSIIAEHTWTLGNNKVNEFRFQFARRSVNYSYSNAPGGSDVAVNMPGVAYFGREPFSYVQRVEKRWEFLDNFSINKGTHNIKFGVDYNLIPLTADFTVNFGGIYDFGAVPLSGTPGLTPVQAYGAGLPSYLVQGVGNPHLSFNNNTIGLFVQDSWRVKPRLTVNYGLRYDNEFLPNYAPSTALAGAAYKTFGLTKGVPSDNLQFAPRIGLAYDVFGDGKTVTRASYGIFFDHPLMALVFDSVVADGTQAPQILLGGASPVPCDASAAGIVTTLNAGNAFTGTLNCLPPAFTYIPGQQRFNPTPNTPSVWVNQNYLQPGSFVPLSNLPFGYPTAANFKYGYSNQVNVGIEHQFGESWTFDISYNFNGGRRLNRPINANTANGNLLVQNWYNAMTDPNLTQSAKSAFANNPLAVDVAGVNLAVAAKCGNPACGAYIPPALVSFFRQSGFNPTLQYYAPPQLNGLAQQVMSYYGLGVGNQAIPFSDLVANYSNGTSDYSGMTVNLKKRFSNHYEMLASYTWSHSIDDATDLEATLEPQDNFHPNLDRSTSLFDQRQRFVISGVYQSGNQGSDTKGKLLSNWTTSIILELA